MKCASLGITELSEPQTKVNRKREENREQRYRNERQEGKRLLRWGLV